MKAYILIAILFITSCTFKKEEKPITPKKKPQKTIQVVKEPLTGTTEIIETFTDSLHIGKKKNSKIEIIKYSISDQNYVSVKFYTKGSGYWYIQNTYIYECDALMDLQLGVMLKVATCFFPKWPHITLQTGHSVSLESGQSADFKAF